MWTLYIILIIVWLLLLSDLRGFRRLGRMVRRAMVRAKKAPAKAADLPPISVVVTVKNQLDLVERNINAFLTQDYPEYEVWVVDMSTDDDTRWFLASKMDDYKHLHHTPVRPATRIISQTALAYTLGFRAASFDWVMLTSIDCAPTSDKWLRHMGLEAARLPKKKIIQGYTRYDKPSTKWAGLRLRFARAYEQMFMLPFSIRHRLHTSRGTNVMYRKSLFLKYHGFQRGERLSMGAIEILVNQHSTRSNTTLCLHPEAILTQQVPAEAHHWTASRTREVEIARHFKHHKQYSIAATYHALLPWAFALWFAHAWHALWVAGEWGMLTGAVLMLLICLLTAIKAFNYTLFRLGEKPILFRLPLLILLVPYWRLEAHLLHLFADKKPWRTLPKAADLEDEF